MHFEMTTFTRTTARLTVILCHWLFWILWMCVSSQVALCYTYAAGLQIDSKHQLDLIDALRVYNNTYSGLSVVEGIHRLSPAVLLQGDSRHIELPAEMFHKALQILSQTNEFTFLATLKQEERNTGTIISFSQGADRFLELQSSGRKDEIRLHYVHRNSTYVETFPYHLADNSWHQVALSVSGSTINLFVDCSRIYKRVIQDIDLNFAERNISLWLGQRNSKHFLFKGYLQDVKVVGQAHGYVLQCPQLDTDCPTCGQFQNLQMAVVRLENHIKELTERLANAEQHISSISECECQKSCYVNGSVHHDGSTWKNGCDICSCVHGEVKCRPITCAPPQCQNPVHVPGECCPVCLKKCLMDNISYDHGTHVSPKQCIVCECKNGSMHCRRIDPETTCPALECPEEERFSVPGECCRFCPGVDYCGQGHDCHTNASCLNLKTQYTCQCNTGYEGDGRHCEDINECLREGGHDGHHCRLNTQCVNVPGRYVCECLSGYKRVDTFNCEEHDECSTGDHKCDENAVCINIPGSYACECLDGYQGDGFTCEPVCSGSCLNGGQCVAPGTCSCRRGYTGSSCEIDVDECALGLHMCHPNSLCINMPGWYYCRCQPGYESFEEGSLGSSCRDINECLIGSHSCHPSAVCVNEEGGYRCECLDNNSCSSSCIYYGEERLSGETWSSDTCTRCRCTNGVVRCHPVECDCTKPNTNLECCPHCDHSSICQHQEAPVSFRNGDQWIYQCQTCECLYGEIDCWDMECPPLNCRNPAKEPGDCCPRCEKDPCSALPNVTSNELQGCAYNGVMYQAGEKVPFTQDPCTSCRCQDGHLCCTYRSYCPNNGYIPFSDLSMRLNHTAKNTNEYANSNTKDTQMDVADEVSLDTNPSSNSPSHPKNGGLLMQALLTASKNSDHDAVLENAIRGSSDVTTVRKLSVHDNQNWALILKGAMTKSTSVPGTPSSDSTISRNKAKLEP